MTRTFGRINLDFEIGSLLSTLGRSEWSYGFVAGTAVTSRLDLMAELHGDASASFTSDRLTLNVGLRHEFNPAVALIASLRHDLRAAPGTARSLVGYCGCQFGF